MLYTVMKHIKNYFPTPKREDREFTITNGVMSLPFYTSGAYVLIEGSLFNDGVHKMPFTDLTDETFEGSVTLLAIPKDFLTLVSEIETYKTESGKRDGLQSESFGGYSYSKASANGVVADWTDVFKQRLSVWRKL